MYRRGDVRQTARALRLLDALRGFKHGRTLEDLAKKLSVSDRTIRRDLQELVGTSFHEDTVSVLSKFEQTMSASERKEHGALGQHFAYVPDGGTKAYEGKEDLTDALQTGILSRKIVRFSYKDSRRRAR